MASRYNVGADLSVNNAGFIAGFAAAERAVQSFNRTMATAAGSVASAERSMNGASAACMGNAANDTRRKVYSIGDSARDTRGQVVNAMNGMTAATSGFTSVMANNARSMEATGRSAQVLRQSSSEAGRGMSLIS